MERTTCHQDKEDKGQNYNYSQPRGNPGAGDIAEEAKIRPERIWPRGSQAAENDDCAGRRLREILCGKNLIKEQQKGPPQTIVPKTS